MAACILCGADAKDGEIAAFKLRITELESELATLRDHIRAIQDDADFARQVARDAVQAHADNERLLDGAESELAALRDQIKRAEEQEPYGFMLDDDKTFERFRRTYHSGPEWTPLYTKEPK